MLWLLQLVKSCLSYHFMHLISLNAISKPIHHHQLISRRKVILDHTSAACHLPRGGVVSFVIVTGGVPPVSVASHIEPQGTLALCSLFIAYCTHFSLCSLFI